MGGWVMNAAWLVFLLVAGLFFEDPKRARPPPPPGCAARGARAGARCLMLLKRSGLWAAPSAPPRAPALAPAGVTAVTRRCRWPPWRAPPPRESMTEHSDEVGGRRVR